MSNLDSATIGKWLLVAAMVLAGASSVSMLQPYIPAQLATDTIKMVSGLVLLVGAYFVATKQID